MAPVLTAENVRTAVAPTKETSPDLSTLAANLLNEMIGKQDTDKVEIRVDMLKRLCGSVLSQDETKGQD